MAERLAATQSQRAHDPGPHATVAGLAGMSADVADVFELQRTAGNRAVAYALAAGEPPTLPRFGHLFGLQRVRAVQRAPAGGAVAATGGQSGGDTDAALSESAAVNAAVGSAVKAARRERRHVPSEKADALIGLIAWYVRRHPDATSMKLIFPDPENLYELLAPWGFVGRHVEFDEQRGKLVDRQPLDSLEASLAAWSGEDTKARAARRAKMGSSMGMWARDVKPLEMAKDDEAILAGPNRSDPSEPWGPDYTGTRAARRSERERLKNEHALGMARGIATQGPGAFAGMVGGGLVGLLPGMDFHKSTEVGMKVGSMADAWIMAKAQAPGGGGGGSGGRNQAAIVEKAGPRQPMPTPDKPGAPGGGGGGGSGGAGRTQSGMGALGPAGPGASPRPGLPTSPGMGVANVATPGPGAPSVARPIKAGPVAAVSPDTAIAMHKNNPNRVRHSLSDSWHRFNWMEHLVQNRQWNPGMGPLPEPPMAFRLKGGMIQVNDVQWLRERGNLADIVRPGELTGGTGPGSAGGGGGARGGGSGTLGAGSAGKTQVGVPAGPGASSGPARSGKTEVGVPQGPRGIEMPLKVPEGPPPRPPGNTVKPANQDEVKALFAKQPERVVVGGDSLEFHQYLWELKNWQDGKRVTSAAPAAFWEPRGFVRVHHVLWERDGGKISDILKPDVPARAEPNAFEAAPTLPGGDAGGAGSTNVSIVPGGKR